MINLLLIDDSEDELFLLEGELIYGGLSPFIQRVDNEQDMNLALASSVKWDIALVDYAMPDFSAQRALELLEETTEDIPAIVVSGQTSEEIAVNIMRAGAKDYISKHSRFRLIPSILREIDSRNKRNKQRQVEQQLHQTEQKFLAIAEVAHDAIIIIKNNYSIEFWNRGAERIFAYTKEEVIDKNINDILIPRQFLKTFQEILNNLFLNGQFPDQYKIFETIALQKNKKKIPIEISLSSINIDNKWFAICIIRDISQRREMEEQLKQMATQDPLTGLANRREIMQRLNQEMIRFSRYHSPVSIFFIDIDRFKQINDQYGHQIGDNTLIHCANRMKALLRQNDFIGRYGGEEFLLILPETSIKKAFELAERVRKNICPATTEANTLATTNDFIPEYTISIGVNELMDKQISLDTFINQADKAMYKAKQTGRNKTCIYTLEEE